MVIMKFVLVHFENDNSLFVGEATMLEDYDDRRCNNEEFDFSEEVIVNWPAGRGKTAKYAAKVIKFSDNKQELSELMQTELSENPGVNSKSRTYMSKKEEEDVEAVPLKEETAAKSGERSRKVTKKTSAQILNDIKSKMLAEQTEQSSEQSSLLKSSIDTDMDNLRRENKELRDSLVAVKELPTLVRKFEDLIEKLATRCDQLDESASNLKRASSIPRFSDSWIPVTPTTSSQKPLSACRQDILAKLSPTCGSPSTPGSSTTPSTSVADKLLIDADWFDEKSTSTPTPVKDSFEISSEVRKRIYRGDPRKMTNELMTSLFTDQEMCNCTVATGDKALPGQKVSAIISEVQREHSSISAASIKQWMRDKIGNVKKKMKTPKPEIVDA